MMTAGDVRQTPITQRRTTKLSAPFRAKRLVASTCEAVCQLQVIPVQRA
jgi:hypothetical protein